MPTGSPSWRRASTIEYAGSTEVTYSDGSRTLTVVVDHGVQRGVNLTTAYLHLESFAVSSGQSVSRGQVVGYEGTTGSSTGCHLHFEKRALKGGLSTATKPRRMLELKAKG